AICNEIFKGWKLEDTLAYAARIGYDGVELAPFTIADSVTDISAVDRQKIRDAAARAGIEIAGIHWVLVKPEGLYINHPDRTIRFEPPSPVETNFLNTAAEAIQFIQQAPSPNFQIILDVKAMCSESKPISQIIRESWPHFAHFHANDKNLKGPGFGEVDFKPI